MSHISGDTDNHKADNKFIPSSQWGEDVLVDAKLIEHNLLEIKDKIAPCKPRIIGVTKYFGLSAIVNGYKAGLRDFGESRAVEAIRKIEQLPPDIRKTSKFHFIGHLQTNKAERVVEYFDYIHSVDSLKLAKVISDAACRLNKKEMVLLQVNNACEEQKFGYNKEQLWQDFKEIKSLAGLDVIGLMCMAPFGASREQLHKLFGDLRRFRDEIESYFKVKLPELSMGMSVDYDIAIEEGATIIRIGRKLFN